MANIEEKIAAILAAPICKKVTVCGLGKSGIAAALFCHSLKMDVTVSDRTPYEKLDLHELEAKCGITYNLGGHDEKYFTGADLVILSPGIPEDIAPIKAAKAAGVPVVGELEWASNFFKGNIIAITGSNGKTTTTSLIGHLLSGAGFKTFVGGNIGTPLSRALMSGEKYEQAVIECSSFQLETTRHFHPHIALWLNLTPNHLDRYPSMAEYGAAKRRLLELMGPGDLAIIGADDENVLALAKDTAPQKIHFGTSNLCVPGALVKGDELTISGLPGVKDVAFDLKHPILVGAHNHLNAAAAISAALLAGAEAAAIKASYPTFKGIEHRLEPLEGASGLKFYNDSKATSDQATATALKALKGPVILLAGGKDKGGGYLATRAAAPGKVKKAVLFGAAAGLIADALQDAVPVEVVTTMDEALKAAIKAAAPGDEILLSPACSSYDQFPNFEVRGQKFKELVAAWVKENG